MMQMHRTVRSSRAAVAAGFLLAGAIALGGCTSAVNTPREETTGEPVAGGTLVISQNADAQPGAVLAGRAGNSAWVQNVFEGLTRYDENYEPQPVLATSWELAEDAMSIDIELRDDVTFHTGRPMTAEDVKFTFEQAADPVNSSQLAFIAKEFQSIDVTSDTSLTVNFASPLSNIFDFFDQTVIVDSETFTGLADGTEVIGTGPFTWESWDPGAQITLAKYEDYRDADEVLLDGIELPIIADSTAQISALRSGRSHVGAGLSTTDALAFAEDPQYQLVQAGGAIYPFGMDVTAEPFDDPRVRQAVGYAIDRERINQQVFGGKGVETDLFWSPNEPGYSEELATQYTYDPERAAQLIEEAGATGAAVPIVVPALPAVQSVYEIVRNNLEEVGLAPSAVPLNVTEFDARQVAGDLGPAFLLIHGQVGYSAATMISSLPSLRAGNPSKYDSEEYQRLRAELLAAPDEEARSAALEALSAFVVDEAFTMPIVQAPLFTVISSTVDGLELTVRGVIVATRASVEE